MRICIDPGHGMGNKAPNVYDPGAVWGGLQEADLVLHFGIELREVLQFRGHQVVMTRASRPQPCPLATRSRFGLDCDVFLSLHVNSSVGAAAGGPEVWFRDDQRSFVLASAIDAALDASSHLADRDLKRSHDKRVLMGNPALAAVLVEIGFINVARDREWMTNQFAGDLIPHVLADAIDAYAAA